jgi:hypothetical protein
MKAINCVTALFFVLAIAAAAQHGQDSKEGQASDSMMPHQAHSAGAPVSYAELKNTVAQLDRAKQATAKYQDVHVAESDGYHAMGPDMPGAAVHFVQTLEPKTFDVEKPPILVYEKNPAVPGGYSLTGIVYLLNAAAGPDGQPLDSPFPKSLARWHRHANICLLPGLANPHGLNESQCHDQGGQFVAQSPWMIHAWIWKDNPSGVFSTENPAAR